MTPAGLRRTQKGRLKRVTLLAVLTLSAGLAIGNPARVGSAPIRAAFSGARWLFAEPLPGLARLNVGRDATVEALSCPSVGDCSAGGSYEAADRVSEAFVVDETKGRWGIARQVRHTESRNGDGATITSLFCSSPGYCIGGGYYAVEDAMKAFTVTETKGLWGAAQPVPGVERSDPQTYSSSEVDAVSCQSPGTCLAGGSFSPPRATQTYDFVAREIDGSWQAATQLPGTAPGPPYLNSGIFSIACVPHGSCVATGSYSAPTTLYRAFVDVYAGGGWRRRIPLDGPYARWASVPSVSCPSEGNCVAAGAYVPAENHVRPIIVMESSGRWANPRLVPGMTLLNRGDQSVVEALSCPQPGYCRAAGRYLDRKGGEQAFVVGESRGKWSRAIELPGSASLNAGADSDNFGSGGVLSLSCPSVTSCAAVGQYVNSKGQLLADVAIERGTIWEPAVEVPGIAQLERGAEHVDAQADLVSCPAIDHCVVMGRYSLGLGGSLFVSSQI